MKIGFIGLGKMGSNMVQNLLDHKHKIVGYNRSPEPIKALARKGAIASYSIKELTEKLPGQKVVWLMVPAGKPTGKVISDLFPHLKRGDIVIDGGNSFFKDSQARYTALKKKGISFLDCGTSGGIEGARKGACMMIGGDKSTFKKVETLFRDMCVKNGYGYMGKSGAGHFVKMVHNAIEYGTMSSINEGFEAIEKFSSEFGTDLKEVAKVYNNGSIIQSKLTNWLHKSFTAPNYLDNISCEVPKGETEREMRELEKMANMPMLHQARLVRVHTRKKGICGRFIAAMRNQFGGHKTKRK